MLTSFDTASVFMFKKYPWVDALNLQIQLSRIDDLVYWWGNTKLTRKTICLLNLLENTKYGCAH